MKIATIYVGSWFQRTTLHLSEIFDFLAGNGSPLKLDPKEVAKLLKTLEIKSVTRTAGDLEFLDVKTKAGVSFEIYEDGPDAPQEEALW